jgi:uncharacterized protein YdhG (YjbR/CyaY superfamily)
MRGHPADTVEEYLTVVPEQMGRSLAIVREHVRAAIPDVTEKIAYGIPIFAYRGKGLVGISAAQKHCSLHLMSPPAAAALATQLTEGKLVGVTLQFAADAPLGESTVRLIVAHRIAEVDARG